MENLRIRRNFPPNLLTTPLVQVIPKFSPITSHKFSRIDEVYIIGRAR